MTVWIIFIFWKAVEIFTIEVGCEGDDKLDKKWCEKKSIPIPKLLRDVEEKRGQ